MEDLSSLSMSAYYPIPARLPSLFSALAVFQHYLNNEAIKSIHVYKFTNEEVGREEITEREFIFSHEKYFELCNNNNFLIKRLVTYLPPGDKNKPRFYTGLSIGEWICILAFDSLAPFFPSSFPPILDLSINPKLASVPSLLNDLENVLDFMRLAEVPSNLTSNAGLQHPFPFMQDDSSCQPDISINYPPFLADENLDNPRSFAGNEDPDDVLFLAGANPEDASFLANANPDDTSYLPVAETDDNMFLASETLNDLPFHDNANLDDISFLENGDLDDPQLLPSSDDPSPAFNTTTVENFEAREQGLQGLNAPSVENVNSLKDGRLAKGPKAPDVEDKDSMRKHPVTKGKKQHRNRQKYNRASSSRVKSVTLSDVEKLYDLPLANAAKKLGIGKSILKKKCRNFGFSRWPYRKINSINKLITVAEGEANQQENRIEAVNMAEQLQKKLQLEKEAIRKSPDMKVQEETILKFRQEFHRNAFDERRKQ